MSTVFYYSSLSVLCQVDISQMDLYVIYKKYDFFNSRNILNFDKKYFLYPSNLDRTSLKYELVLFEIYR